MQSDTVFVASEVVIGICLVWRAAIVIIALPYQKRGQCLAASCYTGAGLLMISAAITFVMHGVPQLHEVIMSCGLIIGAFIAEKRHSNHREIDVVHRAKEDIH